MVAAGAVSPTCHAPVGHWCNGTSLVALPSAERRRLPDEESHPKRSLTTAGGCCCNVCSLACATSAVYSCLQCTGAASPGCAACYFDALAHYSSNGACLDPPPLPPLAPPPPTSPPPPPILPPPPISSPPPPRPSLPVWPLPPGFTTPSPLVPPEPSLPPSSIQVNVAEDVVYSDESPTSESLLPGWWSTGLTLIGVLCAGICCLALLRRGSPAPPGTTLAGINSARNHVQQEGVETRSVELDRLPTRTVTADAKEREGVECAICLCEFAVGDSATLLPCGHEFHSGCIHKWLAASVAATCPLCKAAPIPPLAVASIAISTYPPRAVRLPPAHAGVRQLPTARDVGGGGAGGAISLEEHRRAQPPFVEVGELGSF